MKVVDIYKENKLYKLSMPLDEACILLRCDRYKVYRAIKGGNPMVFPSGLFQVIERSPSERAPFISPMPSARAQCLLERIPEVDLSKEDKLRRVAKHLYVAGEGYRVRWWSKECGIFERWFSSRQAILDYFVLQKDFPK